MFQSSARVRFSLAGVGLGSELHRDFHSTPDLATAVGRSSSGSVICQRAHHSQEELRPPLPLPPPTHPPPPPPTPALIKVDVKEGAVEYGNISTGEGSLNGKSRLNR